MRCSKCGKTLDPDTKICPSCTRVKIDGSPKDSKDADILKPRSRVSIKGLGSRMTGISHVTATHHNITVSEESASSPKIRCMKCNTVNDKGDRFCRNCKARLTS
ncbi:MAG: hypothetical protein IH631_01580 [Candidatus Thorarchaeota archaeon]|jgi:RNA polymerase subunit RPABC4/transcription elongation factor Spt4|nr:hypothetical protein [Candidatus Thorarchaeota archaeon]